MKHFYSLAFLFAIFYSQASGFTKDSTKAPVYIYINTGVFSSSNSFVQEAFKGNAFFSPSIGLTFHDEFSPFVEYNYIHGEIDTFKDISKNKSFTNHYVSTGLMNRAKISQNLIFTVKYGISLLMADNKNELYTKSGFGFMAGGGIESYVANNFSINIGASYLYIKNNQGGFRFEPGLQFKF